MTNACTGELIVKSLYLEPQYMCMIIACMRVFVHTHESIDIVYIYACVCIGGRVCYLWALYSVATQNETSG